MTHPQEPQASASGTFGKTPLPHLLVYLLERQLSGTMELTAPDGERATVLVISGGPAKIRLSEPLAYLGHVMVEEGMLDEDAVTRSLQVWNERKATAAPGFRVLHGQIMRELGLIDENALREGLRRQLVHKLEHLLNWPAETTFAYFDQVDGVSDFGAAAEVSVDPLPLVWEGIRQYPSWDHANAALSRLGTAALKISDRAVVERLDLGPGEMAVVNVLRTQPMRLIELTAAKLASPSVTQLLVYCLLITKQLDLIDESQLALQAAHAAHTGVTGVINLPPELTGGPQAPVAVPVASPEPAPQLGAPTSSPGPASTTLTSAGTQVARVQLSTKKLSLPKAVMEERAPIVRIDGRIATPLPGTLHAQSVPSEPTMPSAATGAAAAPPAPGSSSAMMANSAPGPKSNAPTALAALAAPMGTGPASAPPAPLGAIAPPPIGGPGGAPGASDPLAPPASSGTPEPMSMRGQDLIASFTMPSKMPPKIPSVTPNEGVPSTGVASSPPAAIVATIASAPPPSPKQPIAPVSVRTLPLSAEQEAFKARALDRAAKITKQNYFEMLGLTKDASEADIKTTYFEQAKQWHPDRLPAALASIRPEVSRIFSYLGEAHATLSDTAKRGKYMTLLKEGGATPDEQETVARVLEAAHDFQKAEHFLKRSDMAQAEPLARKALAADPEQPDYLAMVAWLEALKPENQDTDETLKRIDMLNQAVKKNARCERAIYYRAQLYKRIGKDREALADFRASAELNPRNIDSAREVRLYNMRRDSKAPGANRPSNAPKNAPQEAGLFGKLFKK